MPLLMASSFLGLLETQRVLVFDGRYGGGKTALSYYLAGQLLETGRFRYLLSNTPSVWNDNPNDVVLRPDADGKPTFLDAVIILDETGLFLQLSQDAVEFLAFLRKGNIVLLCPSVGEVARVLRGVMVQRLLNLDVIGLPAWVYGYRLRKGMQKEMSKFIWYNPAEIFGIYDSGAFPIDDNGIGDLLLDWKALMSGRERDRQSKSGMRYERKTGNKTSSPVNEGTQPPSEKRIFKLEGVDRSFAQQLEGLESVLDAIQEESDRQETLSIQRKKRRN